MRRSLTDVVVEAPVLNARPRTLHGGAHARAGRHAAAPCDSLGEPRAPVTQIPGAPRASRGVGRSAHAQYRTVHHITVVLDRDEGPKYHRRDCYAILENTIFPKAV
ncbi:hypothetical protein NDU88_001607 [Pleurodeles waltl]|uniref:Uncharacterized protein n=1 Tax=Pleurodeles waltl TaxID=8319 RepID=A0AAV7Q3L5_PLEWA|nr:hypothetical protein NDU88_001607 [Pleurodeles waltl]